MCRVLDAIKQSRQYHLICWEGWLMLMLRNSGNISLSFLYKRDKTNISDPASYRDIDMLGN